MQAHLRQLLMPLAVLLAAAAISPALAQRGSQPDPADPNQSRTNEACAAIGQALALIGDTGVAAEAMGTPATLASAGSALGGARLVVYAPAAVGACADFQVFWGDSAGGQATAELALVDSNGQVVGSDTADAARRRGPSQHRETLRAMTKLADPGTYSFVAELAVKASGTPSNTDPAAPTAADRLEVKLEVEVRARPAPQPAAGWISGTVRDADGAPIAGARVHSTSATNSFVAPRRPGGGLLPIVPRSLEGLEPGSGSIRQADGRALDELALDDPARETAALALDDPARDQASPVAPSLTRVAVTDAEGRYRLPAAPGRHLVVAQAEGYAAQWYDGASSATDAKPVGVAAGAGTEGIDFKLAAEAVATISGSVHDANGAAVAGAGVMAVSWPPDPSGSNAAGLRVVARTQAGRDGTYTLTLPAGSYAVGASKPATSAARPGPTVWWDGKTTVKEADVLTLAENEVRAGIDFTLP